MNKELNKTVLELKDVLTDKLNKDKEYYDGIFHDGDGYYMDADKNHVTFDDFSMLTGRIRKLEKTIKSLNDMADLI